MTVIVGLAANGRIVMGADSAVTSNWDIERTAVSKVFRVGPLLAGVAGAPRVADVLRFQGAAMPDVLEGESSAARQPYERLVCQFIPWLRTLAQKHGLTAEDDGQTVLADHTRIMVGYAGQLFVITAAFSVHAYLDDYTAIGVGAPYALGALYANPFSDMRLAVERALKAAGRFCNGVSGPFEILEQAP